MSERRPQRDLVREFLNYVQVENCDEAVAKATSLGGKVCMPMQETFWAERFGMLTDKFGINWMFNCDKPHGDQPKGT